MRKSGGDIALIIVAGRDQEPISCAFECQGGWVDLALARFVGLEGREVKAGIVVIVRVWVQ